ncbi:MAG: urease accessory protein UreF [Proteobacteria bacterium]|nr:urease accessory protein UreF [Pseudomonadota bacterium]
MRCMQLASPSLPIGAYAYSQGLEMAVELGWVKDAASLAAWLRDQLEQGLGAVDIPLYARLHEAAAHGDVETMTMRSAELIAQRETRELRADDCDRGLALARLLRDLGVEHLPLPAGRKVPLAASFACAAVHWLVPRDSAAEAYAWAWLEGQVLAGVKLIPLGQVAGQRLLCELLEPLSRAVAIGLTLDDDDIGGSLPALAMASALHETQYTRLFRS